MKRNVIGFSILIFFYGIFGYIVTGNILVLLTFGLVFLFFVMIASLIPISLLLKDEIQNNNYSKENVILFTNIIQVLLIIGFIAFTSIYETHIGVISPQLGYIVVFSSLVVNLLCLAIDIKKHWVLVALGIHLLMLLLFGLWEYIPFQIVFLGFIYMIIHNIFVVTYGILRYSNLIYIKIKTKP